MIVQKLPGMGGAQLKVVKESNPLGIELVTSTREDYKAIVEPDDARWILAQMHPGQRHVSLAEVQRYERLIRSGRFIGFMQPGIMFNQQGFACNAQHRLRAQVACEATLEWMIRVGCTNEEIVATDQTRKRHAHQSYNLIGAGAVPVTHREEAAFRVFYQLTQSADTVSKKHFLLSVEDLVDLKSKYGDDVAWALEAIPKNCGPASMAAAVAFARPLNAALVERFATEYVDARLVLGKVQHAPNSPAAVLARYVVTNRASAGSAYTNLILNKTLSALRAHIEGRTLMKLYSGLQKAGAEKEAAKPVRFFVTERARLGID